MYNKEKKIKSQISFTLDNGKTYNFSEYADAINFLGQIVSHNPNDYSAISSLSEIYAQMHETEKLESIAHKKELEHETLRLLAGARINNHYATYAVCCGFALSGAINLSYEILKNFTAEMLTDFADFCVDKAAREHDPSRQSALYREAERCYHKNVTDIENDTKAKVDRELSGKSNSSRKKEVNLRLKNNELYQENLGKECDAAQHANDFRNAYRSAKKLPKNQKKIQMKKINQAKGDKQERKLKKAQEMEKNRLNKSDPEAKNKTRKARIARRAAKRAAKLNEQNNPSAVQREPVDKDALVREFANNHQAEVDNALRKKEDIKTEQNNIKNRAQVKRQNSLKGLDEARIKNVQNFALGLSNSARVTSSSGQKVEKNAEKLVNSGASFESAANTVATSKTAKLETSGISAAQSGVLSRIASGREQEIRQMEKAVNSQASQEIQHADVRILCTYSELAREFNMPMPRKSEPSMFQSRKTPNAHKKL